MQHLILSLLMVTCFGSFAQTKVVGIVQDKSKEPLPFSYVQLTELNKDIATDDKGQFKITLHSDAPKQITFRVTYVGKKKLEQKFIIQPNQTNSITLTLEDNNLYLSEVEVNAKRVHTTNSNSSIVIEQSAIEQIQPYSLADILSNLLPGQIILNPNLQSARTINMRSAATGDHAQNGQFGTAIIIDGEALSNNANLQAGGNGLGHNTVFGEHTPYGTSDFTFSSTDLRQIPANNIEKIEVIQGVASAKYGDMTNGAILIDRKAGVTPWSITGRIQNGTSNVGLNKGFVLSPKLGALNVSLDLLSATPSTTNRLKSYKRLSTGFLWSTFLDKSRNISSHFGIDYSTNFDNYKADTERDDIKIKNDNTQVRLNYRGSWKTALPVLDELSYSISYSVTNQYSYESQYLNRGVMPMPVSTKQGVHKGIYTYPNYQAETSVYGTPKRLGFSLHAGKGLTLGNTVHQLSYGGNYSHESNSGQGYEVDPYTPRWTTTGGRGQSRDFAFEEVPALENLGLYFEDMFSMQIAGKELKTSAGMRFDRQLNKWSLSPRLNTSLYINDQITLKAAYGIATKSPGLVHLQPKPIYLDYQLLNYYTNNYKENLVLYYTDIITPDNSHLKPMRSQNLELGITYRRPLYDVSLTAFSKTTDRGFNSNSTFKVTDVPVYTIQESQPDQQPVYAPTGEFKREFGFYTTYTNSLKTENLGLELLISTIKIRAIQTSFNLSSTIYYSKFYNSDADIKRPEDDHWDKYALIGVYQNPFSERLEAISTLSTNHHISRLGLLLNFRAQFFWDQWAKNSKTSVYPIGFYNDNGEYTAISPAEQTSDAYTHLIKGDTNRSSSYQNRVYSNYHLKLSKEIHTIFRLSFYANNFLNYRPLAHDRLKDEYTKLNEVPAFGMELRLTIN